MNGVKENLPEKKVESSDDDLKGDFMQLGMKFLDCIINPSKITETAKEALNNFQKLKNIFDKDLRKFESESKELISEGDRLRNLVRNNWQGIERCGSDEEYLLQEIKIASDLEKKLTTKKQIGE